MQLNFIQGSETEATNTLPDPKTNLT